VKRESGFTLLEVLIALTVLAVGVAMTLSLISGSLGNIRKVREQARAVEHAQSVMESTLLDDSIKGATTLNGEFDDGTRWSVVVSEVQMPASPTALSSMSQNQPLPTLLTPPKVLSYVVEIMEPTSRTPDVRLQTLKLVSDVQSAGSAGVPR
jgi:prepilin-type N-terminal cleavage/methylation domain-containing protein